jgi:hypothetical protein
MKRDLHLPALFALASVLGASPLACNVFLSLDRCTADAECPSGFACDLQARFCVDRRAESGAPAEASILEAGSPDGDATNADADASTLCDVGAPFSKISLVQGLEGREIGSARLTPDERAIVFSGFNGCTTESCIDLFRAERGERTVPFEVQPLQQALMPGVNTPLASEYWPTFTADGLLLFLESSRSSAKLPDGGYGFERARIWSATRPNQTAQFSEPYLQDIFNVDSANEGAPYLHPDGTSLYFISNGRSSKGGLDLFVATLDTFGGASSVKNMDAVNTAFSESAPVVSRDDRVLYFARESEPHHEIWVATRSSPLLTFGAPRRVSEVNTGYNEWPSWVSEDQCRLYFVSNRPPVGDGGAGQYHLWLAERSPF